MDTSYRLDFSTLNTSDLGQTNFNGSTKLAKMYMHRFVKTCLSKLKIKIKPFMYIDFKTLLMLLLGLVSNIVHHVNQSFFGNVLKLCFYLLNNARKLNYWSGSHSLQLKWRCPIQRPLAASTWINPENQEKVASLRVNLCHHMKVR